MGLGLPALRCSGKLKAAVADFAVVGFSRNVVPRRFSPTTALLPTVSVPVTHPKGEALGSPLKDCSVRSTIGGGPVRRTPGVGLGWGLPRSKACPRGGWVDWQ